MELGKKPPDPLRGGENQGEPVSKFCEDKKITTLRFKTQNLVEVTVAADAAVKKPSLFQVLQKLMQCQLHRFKVVISSRIRCCLEYS